MTRTLTNLIHRGVEELAAFLMRIARTRQDPPTLADEFRTAHYVRMPDRLLVSKGKAAERLGISIRTVKRLVATGQLPRIYIERLARFVSAISRRT